MNSDQALQNFLAAMAKLPPAPAVSFRGWIAEPHLPAHTLVTRGITATSVDPIVATAGWSTGTLGIIVGRNGRDLTHFSPFPAALEITYLPGTMFHAHPASRIADLPVRVYEEYTPSADGIRPMGIDPLEVVSMVTEELKKGGELKIPVDYCARFTSPLE